MDELDVIRKVLDSPPPSPSATFQARNRLIAAIDDPSPSPRRPRSTRWVLAGGVALAGLATAALVVPLAAGPGLSGRTTPGTVAAPPAAPPAQLSAHAILLAAAGRAQQAPTETGRYWHVRKVGVFGPRSVGAKSARYDLVGRELSETWVARVANDRSWAGDRQLGYRPRTDADRQAWRDAGSPEHWDVEVDSASGTRRLSTRPGEPRLVPSDHSRRFLEDLGGFDLAALEKLPDDPAKLRAFFVERIASHMGCPAGTSHGNVCLFSALTALLVDAPAPPAVRAAAFAVLADIPNVRALGEVQDGEGRSGLGIQLDGTSAAVADQHKLIIDRSTYRLLAHEYVARPVGKPQARPIKESNTVILAAGWTDKTPEPPAIP